VKSKTGAEWDDVTPTQVIFRWQLFLPSAFLAPSRRGAMIILDSFPASTAQTLLLSWKLNLREEEKARRESYTGRKKDRKATYI